MFPRAPPSKTPDRAREAFESGNLTLRVHNDLQFGLMLCDDWIEIGHYDDETGLLKTYIDTPSPTAREWAEDVYAGYRDESTLLSEHPELSELLPAGTETND